ncbi:MAG TPA: acyl carrier protein [Puia sp.]|jgi:acyl carrier protein
MNAIVDKSGISDKIRTIITEKLGVDHAILTDMASFANDLGLDSLDVLETFMAIEKEFSIKITDEDAEKLTTVGSVINYVTEKRAR